ncbi:nuclear transport factor 2 family protein [Psychroserpens ponticola]|uniref:Nuclear transport factor 2 family protein n=1 Tax=Psychroserpens ponticola TaxID=2932268 RepID=A0ABY7S2E5_9FLAO|nr:nuclear transport factor 2 family protein [Psychroserpens ponticola]WCO03081.1 nuclear transport factor 2 family protein [Psychroserpens ponticola]
MKDVIETFYKAFNNLDAETMVSCYHDDIIFEDPAFGVLKGKRAKNMWRMLCKSQKNKDFVVKFSNIKATNHEGSASWEAFYTFSKTGRKVHNIIEASFEFKDGKIIKHTDTFNLHKWSKQALGLKGFILGKTMYFSNKLKAQTNRLLDTFEKKQS